METYVHPLTYANSPAKTFDRIAGPAGYMDKDAALRYLPNRLLHCIELIKASVSYWNSTAPRHYKTSFDMSLRQDQILKAAEYVSTELLLKAKIVSDAFIEILTYHHYKVLRQPSQPFEVLKVQLYSKNR